MRTTGLAVPLSVSSVKWGVHVRSSSLGLCEWPHDRRWVGMVGGGLGWWAVGGGRWVGMVSGGRRVVGWDGGRWVGGRGGGVGAAG